MPKKEEVWPDDIHPMFSQRQVVSVCLGFRLAVTFFFLAKVPHFAFLNIERVSVKLHTYVISLLKLILNKYRFVGGAPFPFLAKIPFSAFF